MPKTKVLQFIRHSKDSKNCCRYDEVSKGNEPPVLKQLYVQKWFAQDARTLLVSITIDGPPEPEPETLPASSVIPQPDIGPVHKV